MIDPVAAFTRFLGELLMEIVGNLAQEGFDHLRVPRAKFDAGRMVNRANDQLKTFRRHELAEVPDNEWSAALGAVQDSLRHVGPMDLALALRFDLQPQLFEEYVRTTAVSIRQAAALGEAGEAAYDQILRQACSEIFRAITESPGFDRRVSVTTLQTARDVQRAIRELAHQGNARAMDFEGRYLSFVTQKLGRFELFGVDLGRAPRTHSFDDAYVSLALARSGRRAADGDDELTGAGIDVVHALSEHRRVLLRGDAGAGKTTLLRWLATHASSGTSQTDAGWGDLVPFFLWLRQFAQRELPGPEELVEATARAVAGSMPSGWASDRFSDGRALLLVDGVDELPSTRRGGEGVVAGPRHRLRQGLLCGDDPSVRGQQRLAERV